MTGAFAIRGAKQDDVEDLARLWFDGWQDAHAGILPNELAKSRTVESFRERLINALPSVSVAERSGRVLGFVMLKENELNQLYVVEHARGTGVADVLMRRAVEQLKTNGCKVGWLACAIGNERAARFYEKSGWKRTGTEAIQLETRDGALLLDIWRYELELHL
jgi:GNAT superfamily N-acetyltransferase